MIHRFYLLTEGEKDTIITKLDHIRIHSKDRSVIADDCDGIELIIAKLETI
jgi:hypothetical protein